MDSHLFACVSDINKIKREAAEKNSRSRREEAEQIINKLQFMSCQQQEEQQTAKMELVREEEHGKQAKTKRNDTKGRQKKKRMSKRRIVYVAQHK